MISTDWTDYTTCCIFKHFVWHCDWYGILCMCVSVCRSQNLTVPNSTLLSVYCAFAQRVHRGKKSWNKNSDFLSVELRYLFIFIHIWGGKLPSRTSACHWFWWLNVNLMMESVFRAVSNAQNKIKSIFSPNCQFCWKLNEWWKRSIFWSK